MARWSWRVVADVAWRVVAAVVPWEDMAVVFAVLVGEGGCVALLLARASCAGDGGDVLGARGLSSKPRRLGGRVVDAAGRPGPRKIPYHC